MKKRILSILLTLCMVLCIVSAGVFAEGGASEGSYAIRYGTDGIHGYSTESGYSYIYYGEHNGNPVKWRVLDTKTNTGTDNALFLMTDECMGSLRNGYILFNPTDKDDRALWKGSDAQTWCTNFYNTAFTTEERTLIPAITQASSVYLYRAPADPPYFPPMRLQICSLEAEYVFAPSIQDILNADYGFIDPKSRIAEPFDSAGYGSRYWLRSFEISEKLPFYIGEHSDLSGDYGDQVAAIRPVMNLSTAGGNILFSSAAVGGKPDGGLTEVPEYTGNEWKLTLKDSNRSDFAVTSTAVTAYTKGSTVNISYTGAKTGANEYVSALFVDDNGNPTYYGRSNAPLTETDGTVQLSVPAGFAEGSYTLKVFNEQYNGDRKTDYASDFTDIALTVENQPDEQFTLAPGGRYYFDLSAMNIPGTANSNLPDSTLHYVPFTYVGTVDAYSMENETDTAKQPYEHSLFIADYNVKCSLQRETLAEMNLIYGQTYTASNVNYTLRAPSVGDHHRNEGEGSGLAPIDNEWDTIYQKSADYIKNWYKMRSFGQDIGTGNVEGMYLSRGGHFAAQATFWARPTLPVRDIGFRPVLELPTGLAADSLKIVELRTGEFMPGEQQNSINIIVKKGESFTAPATEGLPRPDAASENALLWWTDGNGSFYRPGDTVPADVSELLLVCDYDVTYLPGAYGAGEAMTESKRHNVALTLPGALFTRTGHTQVGWATTDGGEKVYGFGDIYTQNEALTLFPVWNTNKYTITFDTAGGSEIAPITQDYGSVITAPADPTREGYTFIGWDREVPETMPAENMTVTAQWEINQYTITFDTAGGSEIAPITQDYGTAITAPADPTREGYTFIGWDMEIPTTMPAENMTVTAQWEINQYTITFDTAGGSEIAPITQDYGTAITAPADPTREGYTFIGWDTEIPKTMPAENITLKVRWKDTEKPTGEIIIGTNKWHSFLNKLTLGLFFKDTQTVTINASDNSGIVFVSYLITDQELSETELQSLVYRAYEEPFCIDPNGEYIVYAMLVDESLNITYLRSDRITLDNVQPVIGGIENGKTYCEAQTVTVDEKYVNTITVNGTEVTLDENNSFTLSPADDGQKIVVTDKAGNTSEMTVTVNDGHTFGEWQSNGDGTHTRQCTVDGCNGLETKDCSGGKATCAEKAICEVCGKAYGEPDPNNHAGLMHIPAKAATKTAEGNIEYWYCEGCNKYYSDAAADKEITKADTVTAKLAEDKKPPKTGDTSNLALWIALLFIGGCAFAALTLKGKRQED